MIDSLTLREITIHVHGSDGEADARMTTQALYGHVCSLITKTLTRTSQQLSKTNSKSSGSRFTVGGKLEQQVHIHCWEQVLRTRGRYQLYGISSQNRVSRVTASVANQLLEQRVKKNW